MINKVRIIFKSFRILIEKFQQFWNVKVSSRRPTSSNASTVDVSEPAWVEEEARESAQSLKDKQVRMEQQVYRIWT